MCFKALKYEVNKVNSQIVSHEFSTDSFDKQYFTHRFVVVRTFKQLIPGTSNRGKNRCSVLFSTKIFSG